MRIISIALFVTVLFLDVIQQAPTCDAQIVRAEAITSYEMTGENDIGVGRIEVRITPDFMPSQLGLSGIELLSTAHCVYYPAFENREIPQLVKGIFSGSDRPLGQFIGSILESQSPSVVIHFLFTGHQPLELTVLGNRPIHLTLVPRDMPHRHRQLLDGWWKQFTAQPELLAPRDDYPPLIENYLQTMLASRFGYKTIKHQATPVLPIGPAAAWSASGVDWRDQFTEQLGFMLQPESLVMAMQRSRFTDPAIWLEPATEPLPQPLIADTVESKLKDMSLEEVPPNDSLLKEASGDSTSVQEKQVSQTVERMARFVPVDCFYVRFGSFENFVWVQDTLSSWGGDLQNLISLRGLNHGMSQRMEQQLGLKLTTISRWFGSSVVDDVALIGTDLFMQEGGSYAVLFQARNNLVLSADLGRQRQQKAMTSLGKIKIEKLNIDGHAVSLLQSDDGVIRSYYATVDNFHLISRSREVVRKFLAVVPDENSLGVNPEFELARQKMPVAADYTIFAYFSRAMLTNLTGPAYRINMQRRLQAQADIQLVELARLAARGEMQPHKTIDQLKQGGYLPQTFGPPMASVAIRTSTENNESDNSVHHNTGTVLTPDGDVYDAIWGRPGHLLPIADQPIDSCSPNEANLYETFRRFFQSHWQSLDPIFVGMKRHEETIDGEIQDRIEIDLNVAPLSIRNYQQVQSLLAPPSDANMHAIDGNIAQFELLLCNTHLFGGLQDVCLPPSGTSSTSASPLHQEATEAASSLLSQLFPGRLFKDFLVGHLGAYQKLGWLELLNLGFPPQPSGDVATIDMNRLGGYRLTAGPFTAFSYQYEQLLRIAPQLGFEPSNTPAQLRLFVGDVSQARITPTLNNMLYARTCETSRGNLRLLREMRQQLHVRPEACKDEAERLLRAELVCPLGGEYRFDANRNRWIVDGVNMNSSVDAFHAIAPDGFVAPPLDWFRGLNADLQFDRSGIIGRAEVMMYMPE